MNVDEFVKTTLSQIIQGVEDAARHVEAQSDDGKINPEQPRAGGGPFTTIIDFDIAVTATESTDVGGGITVLGVGAKGTTKRGSRSISRIKFSVPVVLPQQQD